MYKSNGREKNPADRVRRNAETYVIDYVEWDGKMHGPVLPKEHDWCDRTKAWWKTWRTSPQSMIMTDTDWDFLLDTALLYDMMWNPKSTTQSGSKQGAVSMTQLASEIRQRVSKFGVTYEDRKKLRMSVDTPQSLKNAELDEDELVAETVYSAERLLKKAADNKK